MCRVNTHTTSPWQRSARWMDYSICILIIRITSSTLQIAGEAANNRGFQIAARYMASFGVFALTLIMFE
jgi:hypothetical protein